MNESMRALGARLLVAVALLAGPPAAAQIEEEDLPPDTFTKLTYDRLPFAELERRFQAAEEAFNTSADPADSLAPLNDLIQVLEQRMTAGGEPLPREERRLLVESLSYRARANFDLGQNDAVEVDLKRILELQPEFQLDPALISPKLIQLQDRLRKQLVAYLDIVVDPPDAEVRIDGRRLDNLQPAMPVLAGQRTLSVRRPGFTPQERSLDLAASRPSAVEVRLERQSAVLMLTTQPPGARVLLDDQVKAVTAARPEGGEVSAPVVLEGLAIGSYRLEVAFEGHRSYLARIQVPELQDYAGGNIVLERTEGVILLHKLGPAAVVTVNGRPQTPERLTGGDARLRLPPGEYRLNVAEGTRGVFEVNLSLADRQTLEATVQLRPALTFLGVLGGDDVAARKLQQAVEVTGAGLGDWTLLNRSSTGPALLAGLGLDAATLRRHAEPSRRGAPAFDWAKVQATVDRELPGAVYLLAVLSDDLLAAQADLWFWPAAPAPARPDRQRVTLADPEVVQQVIRRAGQPPALRQTWFGALLIDSAAARGPVVAEVVAGSPAAQAGIRIGEELVAIFGQPVATSLEVQRTLGQLRPDSSVSVELQSASGRRTVDVRLGTSPAVVPLHDPNLIYSALSASLNHESVRASNPAWVLQLNQAAVYLQGGAWEPAVRLLRTIEAPSGPGLGQAAVDYWLAIALKAAGPAYLDQARQALERAAAVEGGRLFHNDGPLVAPQARARMYELGARP